MSLVLCACNHLFYYPDSRERLTPAKFDLPYENFYTHADDGTKLHGWIIRTRKTPRATLLHFHGNAENISSHFLFFAWIVDEGYDLVVFDYRGYGASEGTPSRAGLVKDGLAVLGWTETHSRSHDLVIAAQSLGGAVAIPVLAQNRAARTRTRAVILDSTFSSYRRIAREKLADIWLTWPFQWPLSFLVSDELSPIDSISQVEIPMVFVHSPQDPTVPFNLGRALFDSANNPKEFWTNRWGGHTSAFAANNDYYRAKLLGYLDGVLGRRE